MVFIALATVLFISYINPPHKKFVDPAMERRVQKYIVALVLITVLPSIYLAYNMVSHVAFNSRSQSFIKNELVFANTLVTQQKISPTSKEIEVTFIGDEISKDQIAAIEKRLKNYNLENAKLVIHQPSQRTIDLDSLKTNLLTDLYTLNIKSSEEKDKHIQALKNQLAQVKAEQLDVQRIASELKTQYPMVRQVALAKAPIWQADGSKNEISLIVYLVVNRPINAADQKKITEWMKIRTSMDQVRLMVSKT